LQNTSTQELLTGLLVLTPLVSFVLCLIIPARYSKLVMVAAPSLVLISAFAGICLFLLVPPQPALTFQIDWFTIHSHNFAISIELNRLSLLMMPVITIISFLVHLYSTEYMAGDSGIRRYFAMLGFFTFTMLGIVLANDLLLIFIFWELVGFSSYMLIGHWLEKPAAAKAAQKAFIFNRIGDAGFLIGIMIIWANTQSLSLNVLLHLQEMHAWQTAASLCIFCGVIGKSAQLPLFTWLPDAMEGPTPVSALIHAATMVAAGIFLLARVFPLFTPTALNVVAITGCATALLASLSALNQFDIKKILAYSTISQLGLMITAVGVGSANSAMLHLFSHAFFKAGLFLAAGSIIHAFHAYQNFDAQDIRNLGGLRKKLPLTFFVFLITGAALAGIPLFSGFVSKDAILTSIWLWSGNTPSWKWSILLSILLVSFITVRYTFRMIWFIFFGKEAKSEHVISKPSWVMIVPLMLLALASIWLIISFNPVHASGWFTTLLGEVPHDTMVTLLSVGVITAALVFSWFSYVRKLQAPKSVSFFEHGLSVDTLYQKLIGYTTVQLATATEAADRKWIDGILHAMVYIQVSFAHVLAWLDTYIIDGSVNGLAWFSGRVGSFTRSFQGGKIQLYIFWAVAGLIIFLFFVLI
jgi:NADH-quinone oxidoreductase subunit L